VQVNRIQTNIADVEGVEPAGTALLYDEFYNTQAALLESTALAQRVARSLNLAGNEEFLKAFNLEDDEHIIDSSSQAVLQRIGEVLLENMTISPIRGSSLFDVSFTSP